MKEKSVFDLIMDELWPEALPGSKHWTVDQVASAIRLPYLSELLSIRTGRPHFGRELLGRDEIAQLCMSVSSPVTRKIQAKVLGGPKGATRLRTNEAEDIVLTYVGRIIVALSADSDTTDASDEVLKGTIRALKQVLKGVIELTTRTTTAQSMKPGEG